MSEFSLADYPSNSHKEKTAEAQPEKRAQKVIVGSAKLQKKSEFKKFTDAFISDDLSKVKEYIISDVIIPMMKKAVSDTVDIILYGDAGVSQRKRPGISASKFSYDKCFDEPRRRKDSSRIMNTLDYDEIEFETRGDAEAVLSGMEEILSQYDFVTIADLYDLAEISTNNYNVHKYGWNDLREAQVVRSRGGFAIKLPRAIPFKQ